MNVGKIVICSALLALAEHYKKIKAEMPDRAAVQAMHTTPGKWTLPKALEHLSPIIGPSLFANARHYSSTIAKMSDEAFNKKYPAINDLYSPVAGFVFGEKNLPAYAERKAKDKRLPLILEVNRLRKIKALAPLDPEKCTMTIKELNDRIKKLEKSLREEMKSVKVIRLPPGVAEGAYKHEREAMAKTGKSTKTTTATTKSGGKKERPRKVGDGETSLSEIARGLNIAAKHARVIARKNKTAITKLQVKGKKYVFPLAAKAAVTKILRG